MGQMADTCCHIIVGTIINNQRKCFQACNKVAVAVYGTVRVFPGRSDHIVGIFNENPFGIGVTCLLGAGHGMSADKVFFHTKFRNFFVDVCLGTSYVCDDAGRVDEGLQLFQIFCVAGNRGAQEYIIAVCEILPDSIRNPVYYTVSDGLFHRRPGTGICDNLRIRIKMTDGPGDRAADESQSDKTSFHDCSPLAR